MKWTYPTAVLTLLLGACGSKSDYNPAFQDPTFLNLAVSGAGAGDTVVSAGAQVQYGTYSLQSTSSYTWQIPADATVISGAGSNLVTVQFGLASGAVTVSAGGLTGSIGAQVQFSVSGPSTASVGSTYTYISTPTALSGVTYTWQVPTGATIVSGNGTNTITVTFTSAVTGNVSCTASDSSATLSSSISVTAS